MYILADEFNIKPWEVNDDGEIYKDDLTSMIALKYLQHAAQKHENERAALSTNLGKK